VKRPQLTLEQVHIANAAAHFLRKTKDRRDSDFERAANKRALLEIVAASSIGAVARAVNSADDTVSRWCESANDPVRAQQVNKTRVI
jgi:hypothetical protein